MRTPQARGRRDCYVNLLASLYQDRAGCVKRHGVETIDDGAAVTSAIVDVEIGRVQLDHVVIDIDEIVGDACRKASSGWLGLGKGHDEAKATSENTTQDCYSRCAVQFFIPG